MREIDRYEAEFGADGRRVFREKEDPVGSKPVGRIEYLDKSGNVTESIEYTSEYQFTKDIAEKSSSDVPFLFYVYRDRDGTTIDQGFITELETPLNVYEIIDSPYLQTGSRKRCLTRQRR